MYAEKGVRSWEVIRIPRMTPDATTDKDCLDRQCMPRSVRFLFIHGGYMTTSAPARSRPKPDRPLIGFVVGRYFALNPDKTPDYNGITRNIEEAVRWTIGLWEAGFLTFTPHLNTCHFEVKTSIDPDPLENEECYRAFDRKLLSKAIDFIFAAPNWRQSSGGHLEVQLACLLGIPVFESIPEIQAWASGSGSYSTVRYEGISDEAKKFGHGKELKIALVDGPRWAENGTEPDFPAIRRNAFRAESAAIGLFNNKVAAFTPHLNASYERLGYPVPEDRYQLLCDEMLSRVADCLLLTEGWESVGAVRNRVVAARSAGKPSFTGLNEALAWNEGRPYASVIIDK